jgi:hypothetical protein
VRRDRLQDLVLERLRLRHGARVQGRRLCGERRALHGGRALVHVCDRRDHVVRPVPLRGRRVRDPLRHQRSVRARIHVRFVEQPVRRRRRHR